MVRKLSLHILSVVVIVTMVFGPLVSSVQVAQRYDAAREATLNAPSERFANWPYPQSPLREVAMPADPLDAALDIALSGVVDAELLDGAVRVEPLPSSAMAAPVELPAAAVPAPEAADLLAQARAQQPLPWSLQAFFERSERADAIDAAETPAGESAKPARGWDWLINQLFGQPETPANVAPTPVAIEAREPAFETPPAGQVTAMPDTRRGAAADTKSTFTLYLPLVLRAYQPLPSPVQDEVIITTMGGTLISTDLLVRVDVPANAYPEAFRLRYTHASEHGEHPRLEAVTLGGEPVILNRAARLSMRLPEAEYRSGKPLFFRLKGQTQARTVSVAAGVVANTIAAPDEAPLTAEMLSAYVYEFGEFAFASLPASAFSSSYSALAALRVSEEENPDEGDDGLIVPGYCWEPGAEGPDYLLSFASVLSITEEADPFGFVEFVWDVEDEDGEIYQEWGYILDDPDSERTNFTLEPDFVTIGMTEINGENADSDEPIPFSTLLTGTVFIYEWNTGRYDFLEMNAYFTPGTIACTAGCEGVPPTISGIKLTQIGQGTTPGIGIGYLEILASDNSGEFTVSVRVNGVEYPTIATNKGTFAAQVLYNLDELNVYEITVTDSCGNTINFPPIVRFGANPIFDGSYCNIGPCGFQEVALDPVNTYNLNYFDSVNDLVIAGAGRANIILDRDYNSKAVLWTGGATVQYTDDGSGNLNEEIVAGPPQYFGLAWTFPYAVSVNHLDLAPLYDGVEVHYPDGRSASFVNDGGVYVSASPANFDILTRTDDGWELLHKNTLDIDYFDVEGRLIAKADRNGNQITLFYTGELLTRVENDSGRWLEFAYTAEGLISTISAPEGKVLRYGYTDGLLTSFTDARGHTTTYAYNEDRMLVSITTPKGHTAMEQTYDENYRVNWQRAGRAQESTLTYTEHPDGSVTTTLTDVQGNVTTYIYNALGQLIQVIYADGSTEEFGYDEEYNRIYFKDKGGREWHYTLNASGMRTREDGPLGWYVVWEYNDRNQPTRMEDTLGRVTTFEYDARGNLTKITNALGDSSSITYDARGLPVAVSDFNGNVTTNTYDATTGDLLSTRNGAGDIVRYTYDDVGRARTMTDGNGVVYTYTFDQNDHLVAVDGPDGYHLGFAYDPNNNLEQELDPNGGSTTYWFNESELVIRVENQLGFRTVYEYDEMDNLIRAEDAEGRVWTYDYDAVYNLVAEHGPEDTHTLFAYNAMRYMTDVTRCNSALVGGTCAAQQVTHYEYDALDRVVTAIQNYKSGVSPAADTNVTTRFAYDLVGNLLKRIDANDNPTLYEYNALDLLVRVEDAEGQVTEYGYDPNGNLTHIRNPRGKTTTFTFDGANRLATRTDAAGSVWTYVYDGNGNLQQVIDPHDVVTRYDYDPLNRVSALTQNYVPGGAATTDQNVITRFEYDLAGNLRFIHDPRGTYQIEHRYDAAHRRILTIDAEGGETAFTYDKVNNLLRVVDANGHATTMEYDGLNRAVKVTNPEGHRVTFEHDRLGNLLILTDARNYQTTFTYDGMNRMTLRVDALGGEWRNVYDAMGNLLRHVDANGHVNNAYTYNKVYRVLTTTDGEGYVTSLTYDANGNVVTVTDGNNHTTTFTFDDLDRVDSLTNAENETTAYRYDRVGNQTHLIEADSVVTLYGYDPLYRLAAVTLNYRPGELESADVNVDTHYHYDEVGNLVAILDAEEHETRFAYNGLNLLVQEVDALGNTWDYEYDPVGNRTARIDALRHRTEYEYYPDDQLKRTTYHDDTFVLFIYDENNNRRAMQDHLGFTVWEYDPLNRVTSMTDTFDRRLGYTYDAVGNRTSLTYPDGRVVNYTHYRNNWLKMVVDPDGNVTLYERDGVGQVTRQLNSNNTLAEMDYDKADRLLTLVNIQIEDARKVNSAFAYTYNEVGHRIQTVAEYAWRKPNEVITSTYTYDPLRRLTRDEDSRGVWTDYTFDRVGNRLTLVTNDDSLSPRPFDAKTLVYTYNDINQLLTIVGDTHPGDPSAKRFDNVAQAIHAFQHEVAALRDKHITAAAADTLLALADALIVALYDNPTPDMETVTAAIEAIRAQVLADYQSGEIDSQGVTQSLLVKLDYGDLGNNGAVGELQTTTFRYDANGNRVNKEFPGPQRPRVQGTDYTYDPENRLIQAHDYQENLEGNRVYRAITNLDYDGAGRRLVKVYDPKDENSGEGKRVEYVFDGLDPVAEYNVWNPKYEYFYRGDQGRIITMHHFPSGTEGQMYWFHYDGLGSTSGLTKHHGESHHNYRYEPYGQIEMPPGNFTDPHNHYTFTGQEWDENMGLYEFYARVYDPVVGGWLTQDVYRGELNTPASLQRYQYVYNNPISFYDPYGYAIGHAVVLIGGIIIVGGIVVGPPTYSFLDNYSKMREANTIGGDKYFHCMANCKASRWPLLGKQQAYIASELREWNDQVRKGDSEEACNADRAANAQGRDSNSNQSCEQACRSLRPAGLHPQYWDPNYNNLQPNEIIPGVKSGIIQDENGINSLYADFDNEAITKAIKEGYGDHNQTFSNNNGTAVNVIKTRENGYSVIVTATF
ncbi:MAG TPA: RHS repeat-associated core domain-containing protein [Anaerolineae bacterium]|nr:RHS repeat-associated core domain-containing protein [Anaerolineae bacterium]HQI86894.1 RHS repeat-associated core domain-containing protein [Anaerolineae bacterium]